MSGDIHALSGAYAVDAVNDLERAAFERHLAECADCRAEVASLREAASMLGQQAATAAPSTLRASVLADIGRVRPVPPETSDSHRAGPGRGAASRRWAPALVAAAVLALIGLGGVIWQPWDRGADDTDTIQPRLTASERVLRAPDAERVSVGLGDGARATVTRSRSEGRAVIRTRRMPPAPEGLVYELWLQHEDGSMIAAGIMPPEPDQTVVLEGDAAVAVGVGITIEPDGGSPQPTTDPIATFEFPETA